MLSDAPSLQHNISLHYAASHTPTYYPSPHLPPLLSPPPPLLSTHLHTPTCFFCPSLHTRAMAWSSLAGFQSGSNITRRFAPIRLRPHPPALLLSMKINSGLCVCVCVGGGGCMCVWCVWEGGCMCVWWVCGGMHGVCGVCGVHGVCVGGIHVWCMLSLVAVSSEHD